MEVDDKSITWQWSREDGVVGVGDLGQHGRLPAHPAHIVHFIIIIIIITMLTMSKIFFFFLASGVGFPLYPEIFFIITQLSWEIPYSNPGPVPRSLVCNQ